MWQLSVDDMSSFFVFVFCFVFGVFVELRKPRWQPLSVFDSRVKKRKKS